MDEKTTFTAEEKELSEEIIKHTMRTAASSFPFLAKPIYSLKTKPSDEIESICSDYEYIYYNPKWLIDKYTKNGKKMENTIIHTVLHNLYLHPSMTTENDKVFEAAADMSVFCMMKNADALRTNSAIDKEFDAFLKLCDDTSTSALFKKADEDAVVFNKMFSIVSKLKEDDHNLWYTKRKDTPPEQDNAPQQSGEPKEMTVSDEPQNGNGTQEGNDTSNKSQNANAAAVGSQMNKNEEMWSNMLVQAKANARSPQYGSAHGNMFDEIKKPDRFSKMSYLEYMKRFAVQEIMSEDPDTFDVIMYTWGMDNLGDTPIIEFSETREQCSVTDIIIAIDMSGSCGGDIAVNFLRQIYTLFEQLNIRSSVNIRVVTFDTQITSEKIIRSRKDAEKLIRDYKGTGWGGTSFECVFDYADNFSKNNRGKKLKGLFFFSDAMGSFPEQKPKYRTTFFVPVDNDPMFCYDNYCFVPDWAELVKYKD